MEGGGAFILISTCSSFFLLNCNLNFDVQLLNELIFIFCSLIFMLLFDLCYILLSLFHPFFSAGFGWASSTASPL